MATDKQKRLQASYLQPSRLSSLFSDSGFVLLMCYGTQVERALYRLES